MAVRYIIMPVKYIIMPVTLTICACMGFALEILKSCTDKLYVFAVTCIIQFCLIDFLTMLPLICKYTAEEKHNNCSQCDYGSFHAGDLKIHIVFHSG